MMTTFISERWDRPPRLNVTEVDDWLWNWIHYSAEVVQRVINLILANEASPPAIIIYRAQQRTSVIFNYIWERMLYIIYDRIMFIIIINIYYQQHVLTYPIPRRIPHPVTHHRHSGLRLLASGWEACFPNGTQDRQVHYLSSHRRGPQLLRDSPSNLWPEDIVSWLPAEGHRPYDTARLHSTPYLQFHILQIWTRKTMHRIWLCRRLCIYRQW